MSAAINVGEFPFVKELPKVERKEVKTAWDEVKEIRRLMQDPGIGILVPQIVAAELLGLSTTRIGQLVEEGRLRKFELRKGRVLVCEVDIFALAETERKTGRPPKTTNALKVILKAPKHGQDHVRK